MEQPSRGQRSNSPCSIWGMEFDGSAGQGPYSPRVVAIGEAAIGATWRSRTTRARVSCRFGGHVVDWNVDFWTQGPSVGNRWSGLRTTGRTARRTSTAGRTKTSSGSLERTLAAKAAARTRIDEKFEEDFYELGLAGEGRIKKGIDRKFEEGICEKELDLEGRIRKGTNIKLKETIGEEIQKEAGAAGTATTAAAKAEHAKIMEDIAALGDQAAALARGLKDLGSHVADEMAKWKGECEAEGRERQRVYDNMRKAEKVACCGLPETWAEVGQEEGEEAGVPRSGHYEVEDDGEEGEEEKEEDGLESEEVLEEKGKGGSKKKNKAKKAKAKDG